MAITLATIRSAKQVSIHGRRLGLQRQGGVVGPQAEEYLGGMSDIKRPVTELTSGSTGTSISPSGVTFLNVTSAMTTGNPFLLSNPQPGVSCRIGQGVRGTTSTQGSTAIALIRPTTAFVIDSSEGTTNTTILLPFGTVVELLGVTTAAYKVVGRSGLLTVNGTT